MKLFMLECHADDSCHSLCFVAHCCFTIKYMSRINIIMQQRKTITLNMLFVKVPILKN